jgi:hypothetical protein
VTGLQQVTERCEANSKQKQAHLKTQNSITLLKIIYRENYTRSKANYNIFIKEIGHK